MYTGPKLTNNNLVFGYDTGYGVADNAVTTRFYPGMPTTNLNADPYHSTKSAGDTVSLSAWGGDTGQGSFEVNTSPAGGGMMFINHNTSDPAGTGGTYTDFPSTRYTLTNGVTYTRSWWAKADDNRSVSAHICSCNRDSTNTYIVGPSITLTPTWQRYSSTFNYTGATSSDWQFRHIIYDASKVYIANVQLEVGSIASPPLIGTRSDTASLIDLKKTTDIDVSNVSFTSTGQPSYDETDDHITGVLPISGLGQPHTIEMIFSCNVNQGSIGSRKDPFTIGNSTTHQYSALDVNATNMNWYFYSKDTTFTNSPLMVADQFYHIVLSYAGGYSNNTNKKVWINGVQQTLSSGVNENPLLPNNPSFSVGRDRGRNTAYWPGEIPVWKVYQKALTQEDAISNYKAYKNRFNL